MKETEENVRRKGKYQVTAKGINTINFYSYNFKYLDHQEAMLYCCLLQESERFKHGWFFWENKELMQMGRKKYDRLTERLEEKGLITIVSGSFKNKHHFLINYSTVATEANTIYKTNQDDMKHYMLECNEKQQQQLRLEKQMKLSEKAGLVKEIARKTEDTSIAEVKEDQQQTTSIQSKEGKQKEPSTEMMLLIQEYPFLKEKKNLTDEYLVTEKQVNKLKVVLLKGGFSMEFIDEVIDRIKEVRVGKAEAGKLIEDMLIQLKQNGATDIQKENKQQKTTAAGKHIELSDEEVISQLSFMSKKFVIDLLRAVPSIKHKSTIYYPGQEDEVERNEFLPDKLRKLGYSERQVQGFVNYLNANFIVREIVLEIWWYLSQLLKQQQQPA